MQIFVFTLANKTILIDVELNDTIRKVKKKIQDKTNIPPYCYNLIYGIKYLQNTKTCEDYNIQKHDTLRSIINIH